MAEQVAQPERTCAEPGCETVLSSYNEDPYCWPHRQQHVLYGGRGKAAKRGHPAPEGLPVGPGIGETDQPGKPVGRTERTKAQEARMRRPTEATVDARPATFACRGPGCERAFKSEAGRASHEQSMHGMYRGQRLAEGQTSGHSREAALLRVLLGQIEAEITMHEEQLEQARAVHAWLSKRLGAADRTGEDV